MNSSERQLLREQISVKVALINPYVGNGTRTGASQQRLAQFGAALTRRELEVLGAAADGLTYVETSIRLGIGETTVKHYSQTLRAKLGAHTITHAVFIACRKGLLHTDEVAA